VGSVPQPKPKTGLVIAVAVVVVAAVVLAGLYVGHVGPFSASNTPGSGPGGGNGAGETYAQAASVAQPAAASVSGGPWNLGGGVGVVDSTSLTVNATLLNASFASAGCGVTILSTASSLTSIPATSAGPNAGTSNAWLIGFANASFGTLEVAVFGGVATPLLTEAEYGGCLPGLTTVGLPTDYVNSPAAAAVAYADGGSDFISAHSGYDIEEVLVPSVTFQGHVEDATWEISYTDCNLGADDGSTLNGEAPAQFLASVNATTGLQFRGLNMTSACPTSSTSHSGGGKPTFESELAEFNFPFQEPVGANYVTNGTLFLTTISPFPAGDVTVAIKNATTSDAVSTAGITLELQNYSTGEVWSVYNFTSNTWNDTSTNLESVYGQLSIISPTELIGDKIVLTATASAPVTGSVHVPIGTPS
jgi:hypothetical protein